MNDIKKIEEAIIQDVRKYWHIKKVYYKKEGDKLIFILFYDDYNFIVWYEASHILLRTKKRLKGKGFRFLEKDKFKPIAQYSKNNNRFIVELKQSYLDKINKYSITFKKLYVRRDIFIKLRRFYEFLKIRIKWFNKKYWCSDCVRMVKFKIKKGTRWDFPFEVDIYCKVCNNYIRNFYDITLPISLRHKQKECLFCKKLTDKRNRSGSSICEDCQEWGYRKCNECESHVKKYRVPQHAVPVIYEGMSPEMYFEINGGNYYVCKRMINNPNPQRRKECFKHKRIN